MCVGGLEAQNRVLDLGGGGEYLRLPPTMLDGVTEMTVESWVRWDRFVSFGSVFSFGKAWRMFGLNNHQTSPSLQCYIYDPQRNLHRIRVNNILTLGKWYHLAAVIGTNGMRLYLNGMLVGENAYAGGLAGLDLEADLVLGHSLWENNPDFVGKLDELRLWNRALSAEDIRRHLQEAPSRQESGLLAYYSFDRGDARDDGPHGHDGQLNGSVRFPEAEIPSLASLPQPAVLRGTVFDDSGRPLPNAMLRLMASQGDDEKVTADYAGRYEFVQFLTDPRIELSATWGQLGLWQTNLVLSPGHRAQRNLVLRPAVSLSGRVLRRDGEPWPDMIVQAVPETPGAKKNAGAMMVSVRSDPLGAFKFINLKPGAYRVRCLAPGRQLYYGLPRDWENSSSPETGSVLQVGATGTLTDIQFHVDAMRRGHWATVNFMDGLPGNNVLSFAQDREGYLWIGMEYSGLARYDGRNFVTWTTDDGLPDNKINALLAQDDGVLWLATTRGLARLDRGRIQTYGTTNGLPHAYVECLVSDREGGLWIGTRGGLARWRQGHLSAVTDQNGPAGNAVFSLAWDLQGSLWVGTASGAWRWSQGRFSNFTTSDGLLENDVHSILPASDGTLWFGTWNQGISWYDGQRFETFTTEDGLIDNQVRALRQTPDGVVWVATKEGVTRYEKGVITNFQSNDGLAPGEVWSVFRSDDGLLWFGTRGGGMTRYEDEAFEVYTTQNGLVANRVTSLVREFEPAGALWIGTSEGLSRFDGREFHSVTSREGLVSGRIQSIAVQSNGVVWVGSTMGVTKFDQGLTASPDQFPVLAGKNVRSIVTGPGPQAWFSAYGAGLFHYDGHKVVRFDRDAGSGGGYLIALHRGRDGSLWSAGRELIRYRHDDFLRYTEEDGLNEAEIEALETDREGRLWVGTRTGLLRQEQERFVPVAISQSLANNTIHALRATTDGKLWCGTASGVWVYDGTNWSLLDTRDGLSGNDIRALWTDADGSVWVGSENGLVHYRPTHHRPSVHLLQVRSDRAYSNWTNLPALSLGSPISIAFSSIDFRTHRDKRGYRCQMVRLGQAELAGLPGTWKLRSEDWRPVSDQAQYDWVPEQAGWYQFAVQAVDRDLNYSAPVLLRLHIVTPWFANPWITIPLLAVMAALAGGTVLSTWRYRVKRRESELARVRMAAQASFSREVINRQEEERKRIAAEIHDSIGQSLLVMKNRALLGLRNPTNGPAMNAQLREISDTASQAIAEARQIAFNLRPHQLDSLGLHKGILAMANQVCRSANLNLVTDLEDVAGLISPEAQIHLFRIVQEGLNNVVKHARATQVRLQLKRMGQELRLCLEDDGQGIPSAGPSGGSAHGHGTLNLEERARFLQGELEIQTRTEGGTALTLTLPIMRSEDN